MALLSWIDRWGRFSQCPMAMEERSATKAKTYSPDWYKMSCGDEGSHDEDQDIFGWWMDQ